MATSTQETSDRTVDSSGGLKKRILEGYNALRARMWLGFVFLGVALLGVGWLLDPRRFPSTPLDHGVFAGMFGIWGVTAILFGLLIYAIFKLLYLYGRHIDSGI